MLKNMTNSITSVRYLKPIISLFYNTRRSYSCSNSVGLSPKNLVNRPDPNWQRFVDYHWFKNWQNLRKNKLTASTFALAVGFWPGGRNRLWLDKIGASEPFLGNCTTRYKKLNEKKAIERYEFITKQTVSFRKFQVYGKNNLDDNWLAASPDGVIESSIGDGILEIECPLPGGDAMKAKPWKRVPLYYIPQAQGLMEILDYDWLDLYVWTPDASSLIRVYRDKKYWDLLEIALSSFWWNHVQPAKEICDRSVIKNPEIELSSLRPDPTHELYPQIVCHSKSIVGNSDLIFYVQHPN